MQKDRQPNWQDTNLALFGSDVEYKIKEAASKTEPQWTNAGTEIGLLIWRIEQFVVKSWPKGKYGEFHTGDSYIILHTYQPNPSSPALAWDVSFWIGMESTQDEYGTAAYKTVELDDFLGRKATQHREVQGAESKRFLRYFPRGIKYLKGGVASGFKHVEAEVREPVLLRLKGRGNHVTLTQVETRRAAMNSGDVFILDCEEGLFQWNGAESNGYEKAKAAEVCAAMREQRGNVQFVCYEEGSPRTLDPSLSPFAKHLPVDESVSGGCSAGVRAAEAAGDDAAIKGFVRSAFSLSLAKPGEIGIELLATGKLPRSLLRTEAVVLVDTGFALFLWVGAGAAFPLRVSAFVFAQTYLKKHDRPSVLPLSRFAEGQETDKFWRHFLKQPGYRIDAKPEPKRVHPMMRARPKPRLSVATPAIAAASAPASASTSSTSSCSAASATATSATATSATATSAARNPKKEEKDVRLVAGPAVPALDVGKAAAAAQDAMGATAANAPNGDDDDDDDDDDEALLRSEDIPTADKLKCIDGTCYPVVSDAWGCCLTSVGCSWKDRIACLGLDVKGLYTPCVQIEALALKPAFDEEHPDVFCVLFQGYGYGVRPEPRLCKGSHQVLCVQNRCSLPCDDEVPTTCTCAGYQCCRRQARTGHKLELIPFLPYPEVRIEDVTRGGEADQFQLPRVLQCCADKVEQCNYAPRVINSTVGCQQSAGLDFPSCLGVSFVGTLCCCLSLDVVLLKPVERHPRVGMICCQGGGYVVKPRKGVFCEGTGSVCCIEHRYALPPTEKARLWPMACTVAGAQCCTCSPQLAAERKCCVVVEALPRVKPKVAEASDVLYHSTCEADGKRQGKGSAPTPQGMERDGDHAMSDAI